MLVVQVSGAREGWYVGRHGRKTVGPAGSRVSPRELRVRIPAISKRGIYSYHASHVAGGTVRACVVESYELCAMLCMH
jgi:hypothetical protein